MPKTPDPVDILVGKNIRILRHVKGLSQQELGAKIGISFQQIQKYERGTNRVGSSRLSKFADIFEVSVDRLFETDGPQGRRTGPEIEHAAQLSTPQAIRMLQALAKIPNSEMRRTLVKLTEIIADQLAASGPSQRESGEL